MTVTQTCHGMAWIQPFSGWKMPKVCFLERGFKVLTVLMSTCACMVDIGWLYVDAGLFLVRVWLIILKIEASFAWGWLPVVGRPRISMISSFWSAVLKCCNGPCRPQNINRGHSSIGKIMEKYLTDLTIFRTEPVRSILPALTSHLWFTGDITPGACAMLQDPKPMAQQAAQQSPELPRLHTAWNFAGGRPRMRVSAQGSGASKMFSGKK